MSGRPVPIALLPNGRTAHHLVQEAQQMRRPADPGRVPPAMPGSMRPGAEYQRAEATRYVSMPPQQHPHPAAQPAPTAAANPATRTRRSWWGRLADWMRGPA